MRDRERGVSYYDLNVESKLHGTTDLLPAAVPVSAALGIAFEMKGQHPYSVGAGSVKITIADWRRSARDHYIVVNRADASLDDIPLRNLDTGEMRMAGKQRREGIDLSCHILIRESADPNRPALMLLTNGSSLSTDKICKMLSTLFRQARGTPGRDTFFERPHPNGAAGRTLTLHSSFAVAGHQNATLAHILNGGTLEGIELISETMPTFDANNPLEVTEVQYRLQPLTEARIGVTTIRRAITKLFNDTGHEPTKARVRYRPAGRDKSETHTFDVAALESAFVRREVVRFDDPIAPRYEGVEMRIMNHLIALANRENV